MQEKKVLSAEEIESQILLELPDRLPMMHDPPVIWPYPNVFLSWLGFW